MMEIQFGHSFTVISVRQTRYGAQVEDEIEERSRRKKLRSFNVFEICKCAC